MRVLYGVVGEGMGHGLDPRGVHGEHGIGHREDAVQLVLEGGQRGLRNLDAREVRDGPDLIEGKHAKCELRP